MCPVLILGPCDSSEDTVLVQQAQGCDSLFWVNMSIERYPNHLCKLSRVPIRSSCCCLPDFLPCLTFSPFFARSNITLLLTSHTTMPSRSHCVGKEALQRGHRQPESNPSFPSQDCFHLATWHHLHKTLWPEGSSCIQITPLQKILKYACENSPQITPRPLCLADLPGPTFLTSLCSQSRQPEVGTQVCGRITRLPANYSCMPPAWEEGGQENPP